MNERRRMFPRLLTRALILAVCLVPSAVWACATCFGKSDSKLAEGMNWGIATLLVVIVGMLAMIASFFVYLGVRSQALAKQEAAADEPVQR